MNIASASDGIPVELFQILKDDAVKVLRSIEAGNPGFPRLVQVTSGGFSWWL